jgi:hypothetical protein
MYIVVTLWAAVSLPAMIEKPAAPKLVIRLPGVCRWWTQGNCLHGDQCAHIHERKVPSQVVPREDLVGILEEMGFDKNVVEYTLKRCRNHLPTATTVLLTDFQKLKTECEMYNGVVL